MLGPDFQVVFVFLIFRRNCWSNVVEISQKTLLTKHQAKKKKNDEWVLCNGTYKLCENFHNLNRKNGVDICREINTRHLRPVLTNCQS